MQMDRATEPNAMFDAARAALMVFQETGIDRKALYKALRADS